MILVTGGSGFVGSALREVLASGRRPWLDLSRRAVPRVGEDPDSISALAGDVTDEATLARVPAGVTSVIHLAGVAPGMKPARADHEVAAMAALVAFARGRGRGGIDRFVFLSATGAAPGAAHAWLRAKGEAETLLVRSGLPYVILRASLVSGAGSVLLHALMQIVKGGAKLKLPLLRAGRILPIAAGDLAIALATALDHHRMADRVLEVGTPPELTLEQIVALIGKRLGVIPKFTHVPFTGEALAAALAGVPVAPLTDAESWVGLFALLEPPAVTEYDRLLPMRRTTFVDELRGFDWGPPPPRPGDPLPVVKEERPSWLPLFIPAPHLREPGDPGGPGMPALPDVHTLGRVDPFGRLSSADPAQTDENDSRTGGDSQ